MRKLLFTLALIIGGQFYINAQTCTGPLTVTVNGASTNAVVSATEVHTDPSCNASSGAADGTITPTAAGGTPPYVYDWGDISGADNGANRTLLSAGDYNLTVTDSNGCSFALGPITLVEPSPVSVSETLTHLTCNAASGAADGAITISASGGTAAGNYTYSWSTTDGSGIVGSDQNQSGLSAGTYTVLVTDDNGCTVEASYTLTEPTPVAATGITTNLSCNSASGMADGSINITASGGTAAGNYTYSWSTSDGSGLVPTDEDQSGLSAGTYTVTVTDDNNCTVEESFTLTEPTAVAVTGTETNLSCNAASGMADGSINITASGGTAAGNYTYSWSTSDGSGLVPTDEDQSELSAGTYTVTVTDDNNCTVEESFTLTEPAAVSVSEQITNLSCNSASGSANGAIDITAAGGTVTGTYSYAWSTTNGSGLVPTDEDQTALSAGDYTVVITDDNGCTVEASYTLTEPTAVACTASSPLVGSGNTNILCAGGVGTIEVSPSGGSGSGYTYSINGVDFQPENIFTNVLAGTYTVTTLDGSGCSSTCSVTLIEPTALIAGSCDYVQDLCQLSEGEIKIEASGGVAPYQVAWSATPVAPNTTAGSLTQSSPQPISSAGGSVLFTGASGNNQYSFIVTDANGCETP